MDESFSLSVDFMPSEVPDLDESFSLVEDFSAPPEEDESFDPPGDFKSSAPLGERESSVPPGVCDPSESLGVDEVSGTDVPLGASVVPPGVVPGVDSPEGFSPLEQAPRSNTSPKTIEKAVN